MLQGTIYHTCALDLATPLIEICCSLRLNDSVTTFTFGHACSSISILSYWGCGQVHVYKKYYSNLPHRIHLICTVCTQCYAVHSHFLSILLLLSVLVIMLGLNTSAHTSEVVASTTTRPFYTTEDCTLG